MATLAFGYCGPCSRDDKQQLPKVWCIDCEEPLCKKCEKAHSLIKATRQHHVINDTEITLEVISNLKMSKMQSCMIHEDLSVDIFCKNHEILCCVSCITEHHRCCEDVLPLQAAAKGIKHSADLEIMKSHLNSAVYILHDIQIHKSLNIDKLHQNENDIKQAIDKPEMRNEIVDAVSNEVGRIKDMKIKELKGQMNMLNNKLKSMEAKKRIIDLIRKYGSDIHAFLLSHKLKADLKHEEKTIKRTIEESRTVSLKIKDVSDDLPSMQSLSRVEIIYEPFPIKYKPLSKAASSAKEMFFFPIYPMKSLSLVTEFYPRTERGFISGLCVTDDNMILLCIRGMEKVLLYSFDGTIKGEIKVKGNPFNIAAISFADKAVVTIPDSSTLQMVSIYQDEPIQSVELEESCWSVMVIEDKVIVAGGSEKFYVLDTDGTPLAEIRKPENGRTYSMSFYGDKFFYCADVAFKNENVYCITEDGEFVYCFSNVNMKTPTGITVDKFGNVYISDLDCNNVQRYSSSGYFHDVISKEIDLSEPRAISFSNHSDHFILANNGGKSICVCKSNYT